jgi:hypothetical protein
VTTRDTTEIEVALVGRRLEDLVTWTDLAEPWFAHFYEGEAGRDWGDRPRVKLEVREDETLREVLVRAVEAFGTWDLDWDDPSFGGTGWAMGDEEPGTRRFIALRYDASPIPVPKRLSSALTILDDEGYALWAMPYQPVTYTELRRAAQAGAVPGDATKIYLSVRPDAAGGGIYHEWSLLLQAWDAAFSVIVALAAINEAHDLYLKIRRRLEGRNTARSKAEAWLRRNGHVDHVTYMLRGEPWSPSKLAALLGCTRSEAEDVLLLFGYERSESDDTWLYVAGNEALGLAVEDVSAQALVRFSDEVHRRYTDRSRAPGAELEALFREIVSQAEREEVGGFEHVPYKDPFSPDEP